jgi:hypothetical protein
MNNKDVVSVQKENDSPYAQVPADFPRPAHQGALPGAQSKFLAVKYKDRFYAPGCTPPELYERWQICEDLATQLATKSQESKAGKRAHMSEIEILEQYLPRLIAQNWTSEAEARYIMRRVAEMLRWPVPASFLERADDSQQR